MKQTVSFSGWFTKISDRLGFIHCYRIIISLVVIAFSALLLPANASDSILVIHQNRVHFSDVLGGLVESLEGEYPVTQLVFERELTWQQVESRIQMSNPVLVICMDNLVSKVYRAYQDSMVEKKPIIPSIHMLGIFLGPLIKDIKNAMVINYEVPFDTTVFLYNQLVEKKVTRLGVLYRPFMKSFVEECTRGSTRVNLEIVDIMLPEDPSKAVIALEMELKAKLKVGRVDALWVPNDKLIINPEVIGSVWRPLLRKDRVPLFVCAEVLLNPALDFGTFAVLPDHTDLGRQAGNMVFVIAKNSWVVSDELKSTYPRKLQTSINFPQAVKHFQLKKDGLPNVDRWIQK